MSRALGEVFPSLVRTMGIHLTRFLTSLVYIPRVEHLAAESTWRDFIESSANVSWRANREHDFIQLSVGGIV